MRQGAVEPFAQAIVGIAGRPPQDDAVEDAIVAFRKVIRGIRRDAFWTAADFGKRFPKKMKKETFL